MKNICILFVFGLVFTAEQGGGDGSLGKFNPPTDYTSDRAIGFLLEGKVKSTILNSVNFIDIDVDRSGSWESYPVALWGNYAYLPQVGFMAGVPGMKYSSEFLDWRVEQTEGLYQIWESNSAYVSWYESGERNADEVVLDTLIQNFAGIVFENYDDFKGVLGERKDSFQELDGVNQWCIVHDEVSLEDGAGYIYLTLPTSEADPRYSSAYSDGQSEKRSIGFIYPWALRPALDYRTSALGYDVYDYSDCSSDYDTWDNCSNLDYYGATVQESWFQRSGFDLDWQPSSMARVNTHSQDTLAGQLFGGTPYTSSTDQNALLAHSKYSVTWPTEIDLNTGEERKFWPGPYAENFIDTLSGCNGFKSDDDCWQPDQGRFISDNDVYMEFDDRWAHLGNRVNSDGSGYETTGYPLGLRTMATAHSYGVGFAEDVMFVTLKVRNESGDWCAFEKDADGVKHYKWECSDSRYFTNEECTEAGGEWAQLCGNAMTMPDGTRLNGTEGFNYKGTSLGFYFDADAATQDINGDTWVHSNEDDFMEYYDDKIEIENEELIISMAMIYDKNFDSNGATDLGIVAVQLLDSPFATDTIWNGPDAEGDYELYRLPGEKLKMTDWHWFSWYDRPGVQSSGASGTPTDEKELIQYKVLVGDTSNLSSSQKSWYFHTPNPGLDSDNEVNPHFDSLEGLETQFPDGLDCVLIASCGPFDIEVGEEVPFSFTIIFGEDKDDLIKNAEFAQIMYNSHYQGYTPPIKPTVYADVDHERVTLYWDRVSEESIDIVSGYADFEGYRVYKSEDGGNTWGNPEEDKIYDADGFHVGWKPVVTYDLTAEEDENHCIYSNDVCTGDEAREIETSGQDPLATWYDLGSNSGLNHTFIDSNVVDGVQYTYSVTAFDTGIEPDYTYELVNIDSIIHVDVNGDTSLVYYADTTWSTSNPDHWSTPGGFPSIETSKGTTILDPSFVKVIPGFKASNISIPEENSLSGNLFESNEHTVGTGDKFYNLVNLDDVPNSYMKFEIIADLGLNYYEDIAIINPKLFSYEINNLINQYPVDFTTKIIDNWVADSMNAVENGVDEVFVSDSIEIYMGYPGVDSSNNIIYLPNYHISNYEIPYLDRYGELDEFDSWSEIEDGVRVMFVNTPDETPDPGYPVIHSLEWSANVDSSLINAVDILFVFNESGGSFSEYNNGLFNSDYKVVFGDANTRYIPFDINNDIGCEGYPSRLSSLPFKVVNLKTGLDIGVIHQDKGITNEGGTTNIVTGYDDCVWTRNEEIILQKDIMLNTQIDTTGVISENQEEFKTFLLYVNFKLEDVFSHIDFEDFCDYCEYQENEYIEFEGMLYRATNFILPYLSSEWGVAPTDFFDSNLDGINDNPWEIQYPWNEGDYVIIRTQKFFEDGDSWVSDFSRIGQADAVTDEEMDKIKVVPNPYFVHSKYNETQFSRKLMFANLPQHCTITIFTVTGEKVKEVLHDDNSGNEFWNLRTDNNQEVAPGLYLYTVEARDDLNVKYKKHMGKFSIVK